MSMDKGGAGTMDQATAVITYESQTGIVAEPSTNSKGNGHIAIVYNSTEGRTFIWVRINGDTEWMGTEGI